MRTVGGVFGLDESAGEAGPAPWERGRLIPFGNARGALSHVVSGRRGRVWLPSFICSAVVDGVLAGSGRAPHYYAVDEHLRCTLRRDALEPDDTVVAVDYFGLGMDLDVVTNTRAAGAMLVRDAAQGLLSEPVGPAPDVEIFSLRKFFGVRDGGLLLDHTLALPAPRYGAAPSDWRSAADLAVRERKAFDEGGQDRFWFKHYQEAEGRAPSGAVAMDPATLEQLGAGLPHRSASVVRRQNYAYLFAALEPWALLGQLDVGDVPLGFPVVVPHRDQVRQAMFEEGFFPPVHWPLDGVVPKHFAGSHALSKSIMTLVIDQRYDSTTMRAQAEAFLRATERAGR